ncbi:hypothetical protein RHGRI_034697 [Rhododendron griersonianum]|uniref:Uncharacterized protein n=1 Tax=Rhododendron griersonianum TaxID=479676 RepID=A0AAV6I4Y8_9ERIC|nr:hypothetical protein RHGRI_034697 [Rhododendron griersonianum]
MKVLLNAQDFQYQQLSKKNIEEIIKTAMNQVVRKLHLPRPLNKHGIFSGVSVGKSKKTKNSSPLQVL